MQTSMSMRSTWPLTAKDQEIFSGFDYVSNKVFEEELDKAYNMTSKMGGLGINPF